MSRERRNAAAAPIPNRRQQGFSLPVAILVVVLLSILGAAMIELTATGQRSVSADVIGTRAFYAAETGAQYGLGRLFPLSGGAPNCAAATVSLGVPGLAGCKAHVTCTGPTVLNGHSFFRLTSTGQCAAGGDRATRVVQVGARTP